MGSLSKNFSRHEFTCKCGCGFDTIDYETLMVLEEVREHFNKPVIIDSACRCAARNAAVGGAPSSKHLTGRAVDFRVAGEAPELVQSWLRHTYPHRYGIGSYETFTHIDTRTDGPVRWTG